MIVKYVLHVFCEHEEKHELYVPLTLDGSETTDCAIERFKDALVVARHMMAEHHNRVCVSFKRIDGIPTPEEEQRSIEAMAILKSAQA